MMTSGTHRVCLCVCGSSSLACGFIVFISVTHRGLLLFAYAITTNLFFILVGDWWRQQRFKATLKCTKNSKISRITKLKAEYYVNELEVFRIMRKDVIITIWILLYFFSRNFDFILKILLLQCHNVMIFILRTFWLFPLNHFFNCLDQNGVLGCSMPLVLIVRES